MVISELSLSDRLQHLTFNNGIFYRKMHRNEAENVLFCNLRMSLLSFVI